MKSAIMLDSEYLECDQVVGGNTGNKYILVDMLFNSFRFLKVTIWRN